MVESFKRIRPCGLEVRETGKKSGVGVFSSWTGLFFLIPNGRPMLAPHGKKSDKCRESDEGGMLMDEWEITYSSR